MELHQIQSPCIGICHLNAEQLCIGCGRNVHELGAWLQFSETERHYLMTAVLPARLESLFD